MSMSDTTTISRKATHSGTFGECFLANGAPVFLSGLLTGRRRRRGGDVDAEIDGLRGSFGTLVIDDTNTTRFLGASAVEVCLFLDFFFCVFEC